MITVDSREKKWNHIKDYFDIHGIQYKIEKLNFGDYMGSNPMLSIDRKQNLDELAQNLCTVDTSRFWRELRRVKESGGKLIVLCEHSRNIRNIRDVYGWRSHWSKITGNQLVRKMYDCENAYNVEFRFCSKAQTPELILRWLEDGK